jgi:hypothetical protein
MTRTGGADIVAPLCNGIAMPIFREKLPCVYIPASRRDGTLYTGVTSSLQDRIRSHRARCRGSRDGTV